MYMVEIMEVWMFQQKYHPKQHHPGTLAALVRYNEVQKCLSTTLNASNRLLLFFSFLNACLPNAFRQV